MPPLEVLHEDNHLLVVNKPAGLPTQGAAAGEDSVVTAAKDYLKHKYHKPGNVYLGVVSRLDSLVSGVLVLARTSKAAARLTEQFKSGSVEKVYWALVESPPPDASGELTHWLRKNDAAHRMEVTRAGTPGAQEARLSYRTIGQEQRGALLEIHLITGRKHQIRLQLATIGRPIIGDRKYGSQRTFFQNAIALHCVRLAIDHPISRERLDFQLPPPAAWKLHAR